MVFSFMRLINTLKVAFFSLAGSGYLLIPCFTKNASTDFTDAFFTKERIISGLISLIAFL